MKIKKTVILQKLNKHADMPFCLDILDQKLWICDKMIEFSKLMEVRPGNQIYYLQPFLKNSETKYFPLRWEHYNKIKHDKINCYTQCTFRDLINSLWAYYILINYFVLSVSWPVCQDDIIESKIYKPTIWRLEYPETVWNLFA